MEALDPVAHLLPLTWCSKFPMLFQRATRKTESRVNHNLFETSFIEVHKEDMDKFLDMVTSSS